MKKYKFTEKATLDNKRTINTFCSLLQPNILHLKDVICFSVPNERLNIITALKPHIDLGIIFEIE